MKDLFEIGLNDSEKQVIEVGQKKELTKIGSIKRKRGLFLFMYYKGIVEQVKMTPQEIKLESGICKKTLRAEAIAGALYVQKLNKKNAIRYFEKMGLTINESK